MLSDCIYIQRTMNIGHRILFIDLKYLMNKTLLTGLLCCTLTVQSFADQPLEGFTYATLNAPTGAEWESPENLALNKEQPMVHWNKRNSIIRQVSSSVRMGYYMSQSIGIMRYVKLNVNK